MPVDSKEIQRRIRSVGNTKKITKAMELVAAAKMRKAVKAVLATRRYSEAAWDIVKNLSAKTDPKHHRLLQAKEKEQHIGVILIAANRGLCGGFNREIVELVADYAKQHAKKNNEVVVEIATMGKRGQDVRRYGQTIVADFPKSDVAESTSEVRAVAKLVIDDFLADRYDKVVVAYTDYKSTTTQIPHIRQLLPITQQDEDLGVVDSNVPVEEKKVEDFEYIFEPSPDEVLDQMLYRLIELQIFQALLESNASEHSARMVAMRNASDAAADMIDDLTLSYNQARQQSITAELAEISASRAAIT